MTIPRKKIIAVEGVPLDWLQSPSTLARAERMLSRNERKLFGDKFPYQKKGLSGLSGEQLVAPVRNSDIGRKDSDKASQAPRSRPLEGVPLRKLVLDVKREIRAKARTDKLKRK
jgi:hypothetical protein